MGSYRVYYEERTEDGYIHTARMELTAVNGKQALHEIVSELTKAGIHVTRIATIELQRRRPGSGPGPLSTG